MKKACIFCLVMIVLSSMLQQSQAQCSICTKTAMQLGEKPAQGMNSGILYLMMAPFAIMGYIGYRWWKNEYRQNDKTI